MSEDKRDIEVDEKAVSEGPRVVQIDAGEYIEIDDVAIAEDITSLERELEESGKKKFLSARYLKTPKTFIWFLATLASVGGFLFGVDQSLISGAALYIPNDIDITESQMSMVVGFTPLGAMFGALILMPTNDLFGRKWAIVISSIIFTVGAILEAIPQTFSVLLAGRLVLGIALGLLSGTVPAYISENCAVRWRGGLVSLYQVMVAFGVSCGYVIAAIFNNVPGNWRYILGSSLVFSTILFFGMLTLPESTRWLMKHGRKLDSFHVWKYARGFDAIEEKREFYIMERTLLYEEKMSKGRWLALDLVRKPRCRRAMVAAVIFGLGCQQMAGVNSIEYFQASLVQQAGLSPENAVYSSIVGGGVMFLSTLPAIYLMDRLGRRVLTLSLIPGVAIGLIITGCSFLPSDLGLRLGLYFWGMITFTIFWSPGLGPGPYLFASEVYPTYLRSYGMSLASLCNWTGTFVTTYPFQAMSNAMTSTGVFAGFYCGILLLSSVYLLFYMPETKGLTLEEINELFEQPISKTCRTNVQNLKQTWHNILHGNIRQVFAFD